MTRKDYVLIAGVINKAYMDADWNQHHSIQVMVDDFVEVLSKDNPAFDIDRFKKACFLLT